MEVTHSCTERCGSRTVTVLSPGIPIHDSMQENHKTWRCFCNENVHAMHITDSDSVACLWSPCEAVIQFHSDLLNLAASDSYRYTVTCCATRVQILPAAWPFSLSFWSAVGARHHSWKSVLYTEYSTSGHFARLSSCNLFRSIMGLWCHEVRLTCFDRWWHIPGRVSLHHAIRCKADFCNDNKRLYAQPYTSSGLPDYFWCAPVKVLISSGLSAATGGGISQA